MKGLKIRYTEALGKLIIKTRLKFDEHGLKKIDGYIYQLRIKLKKV